ncbi:hypothetical protein RUM43_005449 [Polyplax serrata]|uniref:Uncharacterized protein n=1 Tax=Polyplax serrata TaxID=468196 RepID=A0AAN8NR76_POLSC
MRHNDGTGQHNYILRNELDPEKVTVDVFEPVDGREAEEQFKSDVDEELVRKAETAADEDLLGGLNMILDKNETLVDVMRAEGIGQIP